MVSAYLTSCLGYSNETVVETTQCIPGTHSCILNQCKTLVIGKVVKSKEDHLKDVEISREKWVRH